MQSFFVYIGLFLVVLFFAKSAETTRSRKYIFYIIVIFSLIAGLRSKTVGWDTQGYIVALENIIDGRLDLTYGMEWSFRYICYALSFFIKEPQVFLLLFAVITNTLILQRLWELKDQISFCWSVFVYYAMFYMLSLNLTRQFVAIAIVFYATRYLIQGKNIKFIFFVLIASLFHESALLSIVYIFFNILNWHQLSKKHKRFFIFASLMLPFGFAYIYERLVRYSSYLEKPGLDVGFLIIIKLIFVIVSSFVLDVTETEGIENTTTIFRFSKSAYLVGLLLTSIGYFFRFVDRIGLYFYIFEIVYIGFVFKQKNTRANFIIKMFLALLFLYIFWGNALGNGQGQFPYLFYWQ